MYRFKPRIRGIGLNTYSTENESSQKGTAKNITCIEYDKMKGKTSREQCIFLRIFKYV